MSKIITRFAPSPTGYLHLGGLRTALYAWLWARQNKGTFILRLEDTDRARLVEGAEDELKAVLAQFGLHHDEYFRQSDRLDLYQKTAEELINRGLAYRCNCTPERLETLRTSQQAAKQPPRYDKHCRELNISASESHVVRFKIPNDTVVTAHDLIRGDITVQSSELDDFVLVKSDGWPTYHLAMLVDDHAMNISHVIRGEEWLPSLPKHVLLYDAMGYERPQFVHLPLLLNPDKSKLSKRQGDVAVEDFLAKGYLPEALINYVALLGWHPSSDREFFTLAELQQDFSLDRLQSSGAVFDTKKLQWYNTHYIKSIVEARGERYQLLLQQIKQDILPQQTNQQTERLLQVFAPRLETLNTLAELSAGIDVLPEYAAELLLFKKSTWPKTKEGLRLALDVWGKLAESEWELVTLEAVLKSATASAGLSFGDIFWPVRVALSGVEQSPSPLELAWILGREKTLQRLELASEKAQTMV